jgi:hypothetical protein
VSVENVGRLILRLLLVPVGALVAVVVAALVLVAANYNTLLAIANSAPQQQAYLVFALPLLIAGLGLSTVLMMLPAVIGALVAEALAIRSWIYHALNGGLSMWVGWSTIGDLRNSGHALLDDPKIIVAAGLAAGFAYWLVAGWGAGFWKPVFRRGPELAPVVKP